MSGFRLPAVLAPLCVCGVLILGGPPASLAATRKAVLIGINAYNPSAEQRAQLEKTPITHIFKRKEVPAGWKNIRYKNLNGAVADAELMKSLLVSLGITDFVTLYNEKATADAILSTLQRELVDTASKGDVRFVYYSGHGNVAKNKATGDEDETIVPADHWRDVPDIRDKEISRILYAAGAKGVIVTMVADSCHSGSLTRGAWNDVGVAKTADGPFTAIEVDDPPDIDKDTGKPIDPLTKGVLYLSAAQRSEEALEYSAPDEAGNPTSHGAFTWALRQALAQGPSQRADLIYQRTLAYLKAEGRPQEPVLDASADRRGRDLLGDPVDPVGGLVATADKVVGSAITLRGGEAIGLYPGAELKRLDQKKPPLRIRITKSISASVSEAVPIEPVDGEAAGGDQFLVDKYVVPPAAMLRVYVPKPAASAAVLAVAGEIEKLKTAAGIEVLEDGTVARPTHVVSWDGSGWILEKHPASGGAVKLGAQPTAAEIQKSLPSGSKLLAMLPPTTEIAAGLSLGKGESSSVQVLTSPKGADYLLAGRLSSGSLQYAWVLPDATEDSVREQAGGGKASKDMLIGLPLRSDWVADAAELTDKALRLGRVRAWLTLLTPPDPKNSAFPYRLTFQDIAAKQLVNSGDLKNGARFKLMLAASESDLKKIDYKVTPRWVYVFAVDHFGAGKLVFPVLGRGNDGNHLPVEPDPDPRRSNDPVDVRDQVQGGQHLMAISPPETPWDFEVSKPFGVDTYFVLTSEQPIDNPEVFEFDGARSSGTRGVSGNPLTQLLSNVGAATRSAKGESAPTDWSLQRLTLRSVE